MPQARIHSRTLAASLIALAVAAPASACPMGSYPWTDSWGNSTCRSFQTNQDLITQSPGAGCPMGTMPTTDQWGNATCRTMQGGSLYDTSRGCPMGTMPAMDSWDNPACRRF